MNTHYLTDNNSFNIFGAGNTAQKVKNVIQNSGKTVCSFIISSGNENKIENIRVVPLSSLSDVDFNIPLIIAIFNREPNAYLSEIIAQLKSLGFKKVVTYPEFHSVYPEQLGDIFWLTDRNYYISNIEKYENVLKLLDDQVSIDCYKQIIQYLKTFNPDILQKPDFENQYFPEDIDVWDGKGAFFDFGSYDGGNIVDAYKKKGILETAIAFEPDLENFQKIVENQQLPEAAKQLFLYPCGVWSETTLLRFSAGSGESSSQDDFGNQIIPVVKVDDILNVRPGYIKFDVEGAELEALNGVQKTIKIYRPSLAISIYHKPDHFYSILNLVYSWNLDYKFFVRLHGNNLFETVLYCIQ